jgi:hypothetical protein
MLSVSVFCRPLPDRLENALLLNHVTSPGKAGYNAHAAMNTPAWMTTGVELATHMTKPTATTHKHARMNGHCSPTRSLNHATVPARIDAAIQIDTVKSWAVELVYPRPLRIDETRTETPYVAQTISARVSNYTQRMGGPYTPHPRIRPSLPVWKRIVYKHTLEASTTRDPHRAFFPLLRTFDVEDGGDRPWDVGCGTQYRMWSRQ